MCRFLYLGCHMDYVGKTGRKLVEMIIEPATKHIYSCDHFQYLYKMFSIPKLFQDKILSFYRGLCRNDVQDSIAILDFARHWNKLSYYILHITYYILHITYYVRKKIRFLTLPPSKYASVLFDLNPPSLPVRGNQRTTKYENNK